jgi:hypothetical protein
MSEIYRYPHEPVPQRSEELSRDRKATNSDHSIAHAVKFGTLYYTRVTHIALLENWSDRQRYAMINGEIGSDILPDKIKFAHLVREMGYSSPASVIVEKGDINEELLHQIEALDPDQSNRFCKPTDAKRGRGTKLVATPEEALSFVAQAGRDYLVQTAEVPQQDWRYIFHGQAVTQSEKDTWRIAYEKVRPSIVGDSQSTVGELVKRSGAIPSYAKRKYRKRANGDEKNYKPGKDEEVVVIDTGNISKGAYGRLGTSEELKNLDRFMEAFQKDLEQTIGQKIPTLCVDIGVKDAAALTEAYDFDKLRKNIVFYEFQVPFGYKGYLHAATENQPRQRFKGLLPKKVSQLGLKASVMNSILMR